jgi:cytidine deaminase
VTAQTRATAQTPRTAGGGERLQLDPEDGKLVVLARSARLRAYVPHGGAAEGAAVRDVDGRTYAAATVENARADLSTSALRAAVAAAASSGARRFEAAAVVSERDEVPADDLAVLAEFGAGVPVFLADADGVARTRVGASLPGPPAGQGWQSGR